MLIIRIPSRSAPRQDRHYCVATICLLLLCMLPQLSEHPSLCRELTDWHPPSALSRQTDGLIWVVDSADRGRLQDCKRELHDLLGQEVRTIHFVMPLRLPDMWSTILVSNKKTQFSSLELKGGALSQLATMRDRHAPPKNGVQTSFAPFLERTVSKPIESVDVVYGSNNRQPSRRLGLQTQMLPRG